MLNLIRQYREARDLAKKMVADNEAASLNSHTTKIGGLTHHTPGDVLMAVARYKELAIQIADILADRVYEKDII